MQKRVLIGALTILFFALILSLSLGREHYEEYVNNKLAVNNAKLTNIIYKQNDCTDSLDKHLDDIEKQISKIESEITSKIYYRYDVYTHPNGFSY